LDSFNYSGSSKYAYFNALAPVYLTLHRPGLCKFYIDRVYVNLESPTMLNRQIILIFLLAGFLVFFLVANVSVFKKRINLTEGLEILKQETAKIQQEKELIQNQTKQNISLFEKERQLRDDFNYQKPGEKVIAFPLVDNSTTSFKMELEGKDFWQWILEKTR